MKLLTNISENYVSDWGLFEGIRELMQNGLDSHDKGNKLSITYVRKYNRLVLSNHGATLSEDSLLLGSSSKSSDDSQRGNYGEGFKIGALALQRLNKPVTILDGLKALKTTFFIGENPQFARSKVLGIKQVEGVPSTTNASKLSFTVSNFTPQDCKDFRTKFLAWYGLQPDQYHKTKTGKIILDKNLSGCVYCGGLYVTKVKDLKYGYDFNPGVIQLNRDRNMVSDFDIQWETSKMWAYISAGKKGKLYDAIGMLKDDVPDVRHIKQFASYKLTDKVVEDFQKTHGPKAFPVTSETERKEVSQMGYTPAFTSRTYTSTLQSKLGTVEELKRVVSMEYEVFRQLKITDEANIKWVCEVLFKIDPKFVLDLEVVKFNIDSTRSLTKDSKLFIHCNLLDSKYEILHEAVTHFSDITDRKVTQVWKQILRQSIDNMEGKQDG